MWRSFWKNQTCSWCLRSFHLWQAPFQCTVPSSMCNTKTPISLNAIGFLKGLWSNDIQATCPTCCYDTSHQLCPFCKNPLLSNYYKSSFQQIYLVSESSQTADIYIKKLINYLKTFSLGSWVLEETNESQNAILLSCPKKSIWIRFFLFQDHHAFLQESGKVPFIFLFLPEDKDAFASKFLTHLPPLYKNKSSFAVIWPHLDKISDFLPKTNILMQKNSDTDGQVHKETQGLVGSYLGINFLRYIKKSLKKSRFFTMRLDDFQDSGWRVEDPILWAIEQTK